MQCWLTKHRYIFYLLLQANVHKFKIRLPTEFWMRGGGGWGKHSETFILSVWCFPLIHCRCTGLLLHQSTFIDTHTFGRSPLDEGLARRWDLHLTKPNINNRPTSTPHAGIESAFLGSARPQTHAEFRNFLHSGFLLHAKTVMRRMTKFRAMMDCIYNGRPIIQNKYNII